MKGPLERRLRVRFVALSAAALAVLQCLIVGFTVFTSYRQVTRKADRVLWLAATNPTDPEAAEARYFRVIFSADGQSVQTDMTHTALTDRTAAVAYARQALEAGRDRGFVDHYRYLVHRDEARTRVTLLSRAAALQAFRGSAGSLVCVSLAGLAVMTGLLAAVSGRVSAPLVENRRKQQTFITSASHALKTPLAVLQADAQLLESEVGEDPWLTDILKQTARMTRMTERLVYLARAEEQDGGFVRIDFPVSDVVRELGSSYEALARQQGKTFTMDIVPDRSFRGDQRAIRELVTVLLDNAFQYSPEGGRIALTLAAEGRDLELTVENTAARLDGQTLARLGERFYRPDSSAGTPGFGIGLSVARAVAQAHGGHLTAMQPEQNIVRFTAVLRG